jgi:hypothetical protein
MIDGNGHADTMNIFRLRECFANGIRFSKIYRVYSFNLSRFSSEFVVIAKIYFASFSWIAAHCANRGQWRRSRPMEQIAAGGAYSGGTWGRGQGADGG